MRRQMDTTATAVPTRGTLKAKHSSHYTLQQMLQAARQADLCARQEHNTLHTGMIHKTGFSVQKQVPKAQRKEGHPICSGAQPHMRHELTVSMQQDGKHAHKYNKVNCTCTVT